MVDVGLLVTHWARLFQLWGPSIWHPAGIDRHGFSSTCRFLPKFRQVQKHLPSLFNNFTDQQVRVEEEGGKLLWHIDRCPLCWERHAQEPVCHLAVGLLQEALYWLSGGKVFNVEEKTCIAAGDQTCTIVIDPISNFLG